VPLPHRFFVCVLTLSVAVPSTARAQGATKLSLHATGACPSARQVGLELQRLMPEATLDTAGEVHTSDVVVTDHGPSFTVKVRSQRRHFRDAKRDCTERARHVAVLAVLVVDPLRVPSNSPPPTKERDLPRNQAESPPERSAAPPPESTRAFDLALGPLAQFALEDDAQSATRAGGLGLRLRYGGGIGLTLGVAGLLPTSLHFSDAQARATWLPADVGLALSERLQSWELELELGAALSLLLVKGEALDSARQATRIEVGARVGAQVRYWATERAGIFVGASGTWFPSPYTLRVEGVGAVGETPSAWVTGSLGAVIRL
jgi:hypothetical protein